SVLAAEGAVLFLERVSPALEHVDSSSGSIGTAVNNAIAELVPVIADAPADDKTREAWLERLFEAHAADQIPYIERLADDWGELCASKEVASRWADRLLGITEMAFSQDKTLRGHFHGTTACLTALYRAARFDEIVALVPRDAIWSYKRWVAKALAAKGLRLEAIEYAEASRSPWASDRDIDAICEDALLASGMIEEAYERYSLGANRRATYLATFRAVADKYPHKPAATVLGDLVKTTPGDEGKWFAAAKDAGLYDEAIELAKRTPCDPKTLARAARDHVEEKPAFAIGAGLLALYWIGQGFGYDITSSHVLEAYRALMSAAESMGIGTETTARVREIAVTAPSPDRFLARVLGRELRL
ncbi:MAG: hypothetical protein SFX73_00475, partial [Kofleriaceae bacterium]|nr:hypothetical protein [Kofleriaceae bacterium]